MRAKTPPPTLLLRAPAKLNLFLEILKKRPDGYHELVTLLAAVNLFDTLEFKEDATGAIQLTCDESGAPGVPGGPENLVWRAAELLRSESGSRRGVRMQLRKRIPMQAGLGGGSSDAAAALLGLNRLWGLGLTPADLQTLGARLGSDVPFFLDAPRAPAAWCTGRGEIATPFPLPRPLHFVLACPAAGLSTAEVYREAIVPARPRSPVPLRQALSQNRIEEVGRRLYNRLQRPAERLLKTVADLRRLFERLKPLGHRMSGSGSSYFALCRDRREALALARQVRQHHPVPSRGDTRPAGLRLYVVRSLRTKELT